MTPQDACAIDELLRTEANDLARLIDEKTFSEFPPAVERSVRNEMQRLRMLAEKLRPFKSPAYVEPIRP